MFVVLECVEFIFVSLSKTLRSYNYWKTIDKYRELSITIENCRYISIVIYKYYEVSLINDTIDKYS